MDVMDANDENVGLFGVFSRHGSKERQSNNVGFGCTQVRGVPICQNPRGEASCTGPALAHYERTV